MYISAVPTVQCYSVHHLESYVSELGTGQGRDLTASSHKVAPCALHCTLQCTLDTAQHSTYCKPHTGDPTMLTAAPKCRYCIAQCTALFQLQTDFREYKILLHFPASYLKVLWNITQGIQMFLFRLRRTRKG